jgi:hypothetical protein
MNKLEQERLSFLSRSQFVPLEFAKDYYGLTWPFAGELKADFDIWASRLRRRANCPDSMVSRLELEAFMQAKSIVSRKWMATRLGMETDSFERLSQRLDGLGLRGGRYLPYEQMASESLSEELVRSLPGLRFRTFGDHNSFCERLHADLRGTLEIDVQALLCATSDELQDYPRQFANVFDCITLKPLSTKHAVWLDFRKPLTLGPDRCSKLFYAANREQLSEYSAGTTEPRDLDYYMGVLAERSDGGQ